MLISATAAPSSPSLSLDCCVNLSSSLDLSTLLVPLLYFLVSWSGPFHSFRCHVEPIICSTSYGFSSSWAEASIELQSRSECTGLSFRSRNSFFGTTRLNLLPQRHDICFSQVSVAADYSDSVPDSSGSITRNSYHPLEELEDHGRVRDRMPTSAEIARTAVEANNKAMLILPGIVHCEPHEQISWAEFQYIIDDFGDIYFEVNDGQNILQDHGASNPVTALIGMDISHYESKKTDLYDDDIFDINAGDDVSFDEYFEEEDSSKTDIWVDWGMHDNSTWTHPVYFAKCLTKAIDVEHAKLMDHPSNGVAVSGFLKPTFIDEEFYLRRVFHDENGHTSDCKYGDIASFGSKDGGSCDRSTIYRLEITKIELFSVYGIQSAVDVQDFQYAEPDVLVHSYPSILERFGETGAMFNVALKTLCKKKGLRVEGANLIGVDSLGMDVRVSSGTEVRTHRFSFKTRVTSEYAADKQIQLLLFPRSRRKKLRTQDRPRDNDSF